MTNKEEKNIISTVLATIICIVGIIYAINGIAENKYTVDQYCFDDGYKITIDWNKMEESEYSHDPYYYGCINNGINTFFVYTTAGGWYRWVFDHVEEGHEHYDYLKKLTEWRW